MEKNFEDKLKNTVGYNEAKNKESFMVGAGVGYMKCEDIYKNKVKEAEEQRDFYKRAYNEVLADINVLANASNVIEKYQSQ